MSQQFANPLLQGFGQVINTWVALHPLPVEPTETVDPVVTQCNDQQDNTDLEDSLADSADPGCHSDANANNPASYQPLDNDETNPTNPVDPVITQCNDEIDNDNDLGRIDCADPGCWTDRRNPNSCDQTRTSESDPQCSDNRDNDGDGVKDSADPGCHTDAIATNPTSYNPDHTSEVNTQCSDTIDNDSDSKHNCDDPGCRTQPGNAASCVAADNNEQDPPFDPGDIVETE
ncbi:MAG: hypothetical protein WD972_02130 [Candidatus Andersenbacteria bacterium]